MDSTVFHNSLLAVLIGSFLIFFVCVCCISAFTDWGICCNDPHLLAHFMSRANSSQPCDCTEAEDSVVNVEFDEKDEDRLQEEMQTALQWNQENVREASLRNIRRTEESGIELDDMAERDSAAEVDSANEEQFDSSWFLFTISRRKINSDWNLSNCLDFSPISQYFTSFIRFVAAYVSLRSRFIPRFLRQDIDHRDFLRHSHFRLHFNVAQEQLFGAWRRGRESEERREAGPIEVRIGYFTASASNFATSKKARESGKWANQKAWTKPSHKSCNLARKIGSLTAEKMMTDDDMRF